MDPKQRKKILDKYLKMILTSRVYEVAKESNLDFAPNISRRLGKKIFLKREDQQNTFSFKIRGAFNKMSSLTNEQKSQGVIAASAGNHAQGVSLAAKKLGIDAVIVMPNTTPTVKVEAVRQLGSKIILFGDSYTDAFEKAKEIGLEKKLSFIHPFDDSAVIAGQGTIGMELLRQAKEPIDKIFVGVGGGGLISGVGAYVKAIRPEVKIIGVQMEDSSAMAQSVRLGRRIKLKEVGIFSDGTAVKQVGNETFKLTKLVVDDFCLVSVDEVCAAIKDIFEDTRTIQEPAGALALAGLKKYVSSKNGVKNSNNLVAITCGANINFDRLRVIAERSELGKKKEALFAIVLPEKRGSFLNLCKTLGNRPITEFNYRMTDKNKAVVFVGVQTKNLEEIKKIIKAVKAANFIVHNLSDDETSKSHIRHMIGGKSKMTKNEKLFKFEFPERPGALMNFLSSMNPHWNISLFNYKNNGTDCGKILVGLQVPDQDNKPLQQFLKKLGYSFKNESKNIAYKLFLNGSA